MTNDRRASSALPKEGRFTMRTDVSFLQRIDDWRAKQRPLVGRSEAIRKLVEMGMNVSTEAKNESPNGWHRQGFQDINPV